MDFYSSLIPPGGLKAEPNGERSLRGVVRGKAGHCNFKLNVLEPGQGVMQKWKVFSADGGDNDSTGAASDRVYVQCDAM